MRVFEIAAGVAVGCLAASWACGGGDAFACTEDAQCADGAALGICEPSGYCSFGDDACPSGRRYGTLAPRGLAEVCVPIMDTTGETTEGDATAGVVSTSDDAVTTGSATTAMPSTTLPVDPGSTGESDGETTGQASTASSSTDGGQDASATDGTSTTTGPVVPACEVAFVDEFDNGLDPEWDTWSSPGSWFALDGQTLYFSIAPSAMEWVSAGLYTQLHSLLGGHVRAELLPFAAPTADVGVWLTIFDPADCEIQIAVENSMVHGMSAGVWFNGVAVDSQQPIQLQLRVEPNGLVHWEYSIDGGGAWIEVYSDTPPCDFASAYSAIFAGGVHDNATSIIREVEWYERCEAP